VSEQLEASRVLLNSIELVGIVSLLETISLDYVRNYTSSHEYCLSVTPDSEGKSYKGAIFFEMFKLFEMSFSRWWNFR
jgi:hypothetical protein